MYGMKFWPSQSTADAFPKSESTREPESINIRSDSITPLASWLSWRGTMDNDDNTESLWNWEATMC